MLSYMKKLSVLLLCYGLMQGQLVYSAQGECRQIVDAEGDNLVALLLDAPENALLHIVFDEELVCAVEDGSHDLAAATAISFHVDADLDELVVQATVDGYEGWLRIDTDYPGELLLDRKTSEGLGLTDAEFLGDNSQLEASDFFVEFVGRLEIGDKSLRNVETNIPLLEFPYNHYAGRATQAELSESALEYLSIGSIGEELLVDWVMTIDKANQQVYIAEAN
jgi:hypothetical protein